MLQPLLLRVASVSALVAIGVWYCAAGQANAEIPAGQLERLQQYPVYVPRVFHAEQLVCLNGVWGNAEDQLSELFAQCQLRGIIDLGRGWQDPNPRQAKKGFWSPDPALDWPAFEFPIPEVGKVATVRDALAAFFKARPAFRYEIDKNGLVRVWPASRRRNMDWLLKARLREPVLSEKKDGKWVIYGETVGEALTSILPRLRQSDIHLDMSFGRGAHLAALVSLTVYCPEGTSVSSLEEFLRLWVSAEPSRFVIVKEWDTELTPRRVVVSILGDTWSPNRLVAKTEDIVSGFLRERTKVLEDASDQRKVCAYELVRRYHFDRDGIRKVLSAPELVGEAGMLMSFTALVLETDSQYFGPHLVERFGSLDLEAQKKLARALQIGLPLDPRYKPFWERLAQSEDPDLREIGRHELDNMRQEN